MTLFVLVCEWHNDKLSLNKIKINFKFYRYKKYFLSHLLLVSSCQKFFYASNFFVNFNFKNKLSLNKIYEKKIYYKKNDLC